MRFATDYGLIKLEPEVHRLQEQDVFLEVEGGAGGAAAAEGLIARHQAGIDDTVDLLTRARHAAPHTRP